MLNVDLPHEENSSVQKKNKDFISHCSIVSQLYKLVIKENQQMIERALEMEKKMLYQRQGRRRRDAEFS